MFTADPAATGGPPRVALAVTGQPDGADLTIERSTDRVTWQPVRGATNLTMSGARVTATDLGASFDQPITYRLLVNGNELERATTTLPGTGATWLQDALAPQHGLAVTIGPSDLAYGADSWRAASWPQPVSEAQVLGAALPVESVGTRSRVGLVPIEIVAMTGHDDAALRDLLLTAGPLLVRGAPCDLFDPTQYVVLPDLTETHLGNPHQAAVFTATARLVTEPSPHVYLAAWTWEQVLARIGALHGPTATWADVAAHTGDHTWAEVGANPTLWGGQTTRPNQPTEREKENGQ